MSTFLLNVTPNRNFGDAIAVQDMRGIHILYISVQNFVRCPPPRTKILAPLLCIIAFVWKRKGVHCIFLGFFTMHYSISTEFSITLFGFLSSLAFNNRIENLSLITKFRGPPIFGGPWGSASFACRLRRPWLWWT